MELYASGFNAHGQLIYSKEDQAAPQDLCAFKKIASGTYVRLHCAVWNATVLQVDNVIYYRGFHRSSGSSAGSGGMILDNAEILGLPPSRIKSIFGDNTNGILGALTHDGEVWILVFVGGVPSEFPGQLVFVKHEFDPESCWLAVADNKVFKMKIEHIAIADNEQVSVCTSPPPLSARPNTYFNRDLDFMHFVHTFPSFSTFLSSKKPTVGFSRLPYFELTSLLASSTSFTASSQKLIYTWGDARHSHLARLPSDLEPASIPTPLRCLKDVIEIIKISTKGWLSAVVCADNDCYVWGGRPGEKEREIAAFSRPRTEERQEEEGEEDESDEKQLRLMDVRLVNVEEGADVHDVGVGDGWVMLLTKSSRKVWAWGSGKWGQLGLGKQTEWEGDWTEIKCEEWKGKRVVGVDCGYWNSFVMVKLRK